MGIQLNVSYRSFQCGVTGMFDLVKKTLEIHKIDIKDCRGQSYDNDSNMSGFYTGLKARIKELNPLAEYVPCAGHSLNLVGVAAAESCVTAVAFFGFLQQLYNFFPLQRIAGKY